MNLLDICEWEPGQHIAMIADTGQGKTTVAQSILSLREYVLVLRAKPDDVQWHGYKRIRRKAGEGIEDINYTKFLIEPAYEHMMREFHDLLEVVYRKHGNWTVLLDDLPALQKLGPPLHSRKSSQIDRLLTMGRSKGISIITAMQLPVDATSYAIGEARITISFMLSPSHSKVLKEKTSDLMAEVVSTLGDHEFAVFDRRTRAVWRGILDLGSGEWIGGFVAPELEKVR